MEFPVTLENDVCMGLNRHFALGPPLPPGPPVPVVSIEAPTPMKQFPGYQLGKNKLAENVTLNDLTIVLDGHDVGMNRADFTVLVPANPLHAVIWLNASRKTLFSAAKVTMTGEDVPVAGVYVMAGMTMLTCGDPFALPSMLGISNFSHRCVVGFERSDLVAGWMTAASAFVIDAITLAISGRPSATPTTLWQAVGGDVTKFGLGASDAGSLVKLVLGPVLDGGVSYVRGRMNGTNDWSIRWAVGGPLVGVEYSVGSSGGGAVVHRVQVTTLHHQHSRSSATGRWTSSRQPLPWDFLTTRAATPALNARRGVGGAR
ncbi:MAG: hypothetical protein R3A48_16965 [Polyangiales bacterium]